MSTFAGFIVIAMMITLAVAAYMLPTIIAGIRHTPDLAAVAVINILLGWTAAGWIVALILAVRRATTNIQVIGQVNGQPPATRQAMRSPQQRLNDRKTDRIYPREPPRVA
jgi:xanthosine utilization system XapX-like protein